jgi:hypothetical protein
MSKKEAAVIHEMVREHRIAKKAAEKTGKPKKSSKPQSKKEIGGGSNKPRMESSRRTYNSSYGK